jgi:peptidoglycan/LPS O-acetylase OafA/YrhL
MPEWEMATTYKTLNALQGLRGIAAILVVIDHATDTMIGMGGTEADYNLPWFLGMLGVQIFFTISGLTMMLSHGGDFGISGAPKSFAVKRLGRILPLYWATSLIVYAELVARKTAPSLSALGLSLAFVPHQEPRVAFGFPVYRLGWTLQFEMFFYLAFGLALFMPMRLAVPAIFLLFGIMSALAPLALPEQTILWYLAQPIVLFFLVGLGIGVLRKTKAETSAVKGEFEFAITVSILAIVAAAAYVAFSGERSSSTVLAGIAVSVACVAICGLARETDTVSSAKRLARLIGDATYSIYLTHAFVLEPFGWLVSRYLHRLPAALFALAMVVICVSVGILFYRYVEKPMVQAFGGALSKLARSAPKSLNVNTP